MAKQGSVISIKRIAAPPPPPPPILSPHTSKRLTDAEIADNLQTIYSVAGAKDYACHFALLNLRVERFIDVVGEAQNYNGKEYPWSLYEEASPTDDKVILSVQYQESLTSTQSFKAPSAFVDFATFVRLDKHKIYVPFHSAHAISYTFMCGLVTRLILEAYKGKLPANVFPTSLNLDLQSPTPPHIRQSKKQAAKLAPKTPNPSRSADSWITESFAAFAKTMTSTSPWTTDYPLVLASNTPNSLQAAGILHGWRFGDALNNVNLISQTDATNCKKAIWSLMNNRYTTSDLGKMVGYTLFYLSGFLNNDRILDYVRGSATPAGAESDPTKIFNKFGSHLAGMVRSSSIKSNVLFKMPNQFFALVLGDALQLTALPTDPAKPVAAYYAFLRGYEEGLVRGATQMFAEMYKAGYADGYDAGYISGYSAGYATGFDTGYGEGYASGWEGGFSSGYSDGAGSWTSAISGIISNIGGVISTAQSVAGVAGEITSVGSVVASFF